MKGILFMLALVLATCRCFYRGVVQGERGFVIGLFVAGFAIRALVSLGLDLGAWAFTGQNPFGIETRQNEPGLLFPYDHSRSFARMGDSDYYSVRSYALARYAKGGRDSHARVARFNPYGAHGYLYVTAFFYYLFGFSPVAVKLLTCFWGALVGPTVYFLARICFNASVGRWAGVASAFFPSLILWSATNMKDILLIEMGVLLPLILLWMLDRPSRRWPSLALFLAVFAGHASLRTPIYTFFLLACLLYSVLLFGIRSPIGRRALVVAPFLLAILFHRLIQRAIAYALVLHIGHTTTYPGLPYDFFPSSFYERTGPEILNQINLAPSFLWAIFQGVIHYLLEPFPWKVGSPMRLFSIPQLTVWYTALLLAAVGVVASLRRPGRATLALFLTTLAWTLQGALTNGNVGTVFRMRDMVTPFYLIFAAAGLWYLLRAQEGKC